MMWIQSSTENFRPIIRTRVGVRKNISAKPLKSELKRDNWHGTEKKKRRNAKLSPLKGLEMLPLRTGGKKKEENLVYKPQDGGE